MRLNLFDLGRRFFDKTAPLAAADKMNPVTAYINELRSPVDSLAAYSEFLAALPDEIISTGDRQRCYRGILNSAQQVQQWLKDVADVSKIQSVAVPIVEQFNIAQLLESVVEATREAVEIGRVSLIAQLIEDVEMLGDITRLRRVVLRLLRAAVAGAPEAGIVQLEMRRCIGGGLVVAVQGADHWNPELSLVRDLVAAQGGGVGLVAPITNRTEVLLNFPPRRLHWPRSKAEQGALVPA